MNRSEFLSPLIGQSWAWQSRNCWEFAVHIQRELFGRALPSVAVPDDPKWRWMIHAIAAHPERDNWEAVPDGEHGLVMAADGALCLKPEQKVVHCDRKFGVCLEDMLALRQQGWVKITFFEPKQV